MSVYLLRMLALKKDATPYELFDIPAASLGAPNRLPREYLEAAYADHIARIVNACRVFPSDVQPKVAASQVVEWLAEPGSWFYVARMCRSWSRVILGDYLVFADFYTCHYGMIADVLAELDGDYVLVRAAAAARYVDASRPILGPGDIVFMSEGRERG
jgi:hypothetical protein